VVEVVAGVRGGPCVTLLAAPAGRPGADQIDRPAVGLGQQEGPQRPREASKRSGWFHSRKKTSWTTSSASAGSPHTRREAEHRTPVPAVGLGQRVVVEPGRSDHQLGVAELGHRSHPPQFGATTNLG